MPDVSGSDAAHLLLRISPNLHPEQLQSTAMTSSDTGKPSTSAGAKSKAKEKEKKPRSASKPQSERLKTVVRRLPPNLPEDVFWQSVQKWVTEEAILWKAYYQGKFRKRLNKENIPSRAYIAFKDEELLADFSREYDGHLFRDKAGNESIAVVEFAPFQKIPSEKKKVDSRVATIEKDDDYISFLESLKDASAKPFDADNLDSLIAAAQAPPQPTTTPLLEALKADKSAQKDKEAILRNHAHYKDQPSAAGLTKRDDGKKKGAAQSTQKPAEGTLSKKAAKRAAAAAKAVQQQVQQGGSEPANAPTKNAKASGQPAAAKQAASGPPTAPKVARPPRERPQPKIAAHPPAANPSAPPVTDGSVLAVPDDGPAQPVQSRRSRPMLGVASRQFEAALSEAGVPVGGGERKVRKEKERVVSGPTPAPVVPGTVMSGNVSVSTKGKQKDVKVPGVAPTILQRDGQPQPQPVILMRQGAGDGAAATVLGDPNQPVEDGVVGGRGGRPRGRGRGRGGMRGGS
ncbi:Smg-4/UPF3 family-domain-containing protein [Amylocystis lapponica]|nr:Smg-4/UPF3 family-domain-containing protein [Amylocystis lapponica]